MLAAVYFILPLRGADFSGCTQAALEAALVQGGTFGFTQACTITLSNALVVTGGVSLDARGNAVVINGSGSVRIFNVVSNAMLEVRGITLSSGAAGEGGAIRIDPGGNAKLRECVLVGNKALGINGSRGADGKDSSGTGGDGRPGGNGSGAMGGAILNYGSLMVEFCRFSTNSAVGGSGGNGGDGGDGGYQGGDGGAGGIGGGSWGGAIYNLGVLVVTNTTFEGNSALAGSGGAGGAAGQAPFAGRPGAGGYGAEGSGAVVYSMGTMKVYASTFSGNQALGGDSAAGGTLHSGNGTDGFAGGAGTGGAIWNSGDVMGVNCTLCNNAARGGAGGDGGPAVWTAGRGGNGGAAAGGAIISSGFVALTNCTLARNGAFGGTNGVAGKAPFGNADGVVGSSFGGALAQVAGGVYLKNSIVAYSISGGNGFGFITDLGHNLSSDASFPVGPSSQAGADPLLLDLADNNGPTFTMVILPVSPAIERAETASAPLFDQRGYPRPGKDKAAPDMGAVEMTAVFITREPTNIVATAGQNVILSVGVGGDSPIQYAWSLNALPLGATTNSSYLIKGVTHDYEGTYSVTVSNAFGSASSQAARITVLNTNETTISQFTPLSDPPELGILSRTGLTYVTEFTPLLGSVNWVAVSTNSGNGAILMITLPNPESSSAFYRVRIY